MQLGEKKKIAMGCSFIYRPQRKHSSCERVNDLSALPFVLHKQQHNQKVMISYIFERVHAPKHLPGALLLYFVIVYFFSFFCWAANGDVQI